MIKYRIGQVLGAGLLIAAQSSWSLEIDAGQGWKATIRGFVAARADFDRNDLGGSEPLFPPPDGTPQSQRGAMRFATNQSQLGFGFQGPAVDGVLNRAYVEIDFLDESASTPNRANTASPRLRHAYWEMSWDASKQSLLVGQTNVLFGDRLPDLPYDNLNLGLGALFGRESQIRYIVSAPLSGESALSFGASVNAPNSGLFNQGTDTSERTSTPYVHARVAYSSTALGGADYFGFEKGGTVPAEVALSTFYGRERVGRLGGGGGGEDSIAAYGVALSGVLPIVGIRDGQRAGALSLMGQVWTGSNMDAYFGGNGQGIYESAVGTLGGIRSRGGFVTLKYFLTEDLNVTAVTSYERNDLGDLVDSGQSFRLVSGLFSSATFGAPGVRDAASTNIMFWYQPRRDLYTGIGWDHRDVSYNSGADGSNDRLTAALFYNF